jgi:peptidyl-prolyl cis-trans isomerase D
MNEHFQAKRLLSYLFILGIAVLFALQWGPGARGCEQPLTPIKTDVAATVNGRDIPLKEFNRAYAMQLSYLRQQGSPIPESLAKQLGIPNQVLEQLVNTELLAQQAEKEGILPSDKEVRDVIHKNPDFQKEGKFDFEHYREVLRDYYRRTDIDYEADIRRRMSAGKLLDVVEGAAVVSDDEVKAKFLKEGNKANATYARFLPTMFVDKVTAPKPDELAAFQKEHQKDIQEYFDANKFLYHQPERVKARHILIKAGADAEPAKKEEAKKKIENLRKELEGGKDFAQMAKDFSEDPGSKENGGDLGFNERSAWVPQFADAAFSLKPGELSQPVESPFGYHLIKVDEKKPPENKELKDVEGDIARQLYQKDKAKQIAQAEAKKALDAVKGGKKLAELYPSTKEKDADPNQMRFQAETKPEALETGEFNSTTDAIPQLGAAPELVKAIFALEAPKPLDEVYPVGEGFVVAVVTERKRPTDVDFDAQKQTLKEEAVKGKQYELRDAYLKALKKQGTVVTNDAAIKGNDNGAEAEG